VRRLSEDMTADTLRIVSLLLEGKPLTKEDSGIAGVLLGQAANFGVKYPRDWEEGKFLPGTRKGRPRTRARVEVALAVVWLMAAKLARVERGRTPQRQAELASVALGKKLTERKGEHAVEGALTRVGDFARRHLRSPMAKHTSARSFLRFHTKAFGRRGPAVEQWMRNLAKTRKRTGKAPK